MNKLSYKKYHRDQDYQKFETMFKNIYNKRVNIIRHFLGNKKGAVLEIGCSNGVMLDIFKDKNWETWGVEPSESGKIASKKGHNILNKYFEYSDLPKNYFDLVILNHTLEHMKDPTLVLKKIYTLLKKDGLVFVDVPNSGGLGAKLLGKNWPYLLPKEHLHQFTKISLNKTLINSGYKVIHFESRSGLFEFSDPITELFESLVSLKKRFFTKQWAVIFIFYLTF